MALKSDGTVVAVGWDKYGQCDVGGWSDIVQVAAGRWHTVGLKSDGRVVALGLGAELAKWNLGVTQYDITISSNAGGSVTIPGEGVYTYSPRTVVNLVAEPEEGYPFVRWTGDVSTVGNVSAASTTITMHGDYLITANFKTQINWALIGGIAAVVVVGLVIFFVRRRRHARTEGGSVEFSPRGCTLKSDANSPWDNQ